MKKAMRKIMAFALAAFVLFSTVPSFAATTQQKLDKLVELNVLKGEGSGVDGTKTMTRYRSIVMLLRLKGLEDDMMAFDFDGQDTFVDAEGQNDYQKRLMAYMKAHPELGVIGYPDGTFRPYQEISSKEYVKILLEALNYEDPADYTWNTVADKAVEIGLADSASDVNMTEEFKVFGLAEFTYDTLTLNAKDGSVSLGEELGFPIVITQLGVESVATSNLKQLVVNFTKAIDEAGDEDNYVLTTDGTAVLDSDSDFELSEDGMTVTITLTDAASQQDTVDLEIKGILDEDTTIEGIEFLDTTIPTAVNAEFVGKDTIKVIFSEPVMGDASDELPTANFEVKDGHKLYIKSVKLQNNNTEALVELYSSLSEGTVDLTVTNATEDFAGFGVINSEFEVPVTVDEDAPVVIGYKDATPTGITLIWSEDIEIADNAVANFYHTNSNNDIDVDGVTVDGAEMTLDFTSNELPQGTAYIYVLKEVVNDLWDNENAQQMIQVEVDLDVTAPEVDGDADVKTEQTVQISFTEDMDADTVTDDANYTLLDSDGEEADLISGISVVDADTVEVAFSEELNGDYTVIITDVEDLAGNEMADTAVQFSVDDLTAPVAGDFTATIYNPGQEGQMILINFGDVMATDGAYSILDVAKYAFNDGATALDTLDQDLVSFNVINDGKSVEITVPSTLDDVDGVDLDADQFIVIAKVADAAGNTTSGVTGTIPAANITNEGTIANPTVEATAKDTIVMTFDEEVSKLEIADFEIHENGVGKLDVAGVGTSLNEDGNTVVTFTLVDELTALAESNGNAVEVKAVGTASENAYGEAIAGFTVAASDEIAPTVEKIVFVNSSLIQVVFDEDLDADFFAGSGMNGFTVSDATGAELVDGNTVEITSDAAFTINTNVSYAGDLEDMNGNAMESFTHTDALENN